MITTGSIHFIKCSIREWTGETTRLKINMDVIGTSSAKVNRFQWKMTQEKREVWNSLGEDAEWSGYTRAIATWDDVRKEHGTKNVKLWIGKLHDRLRFVPGKTQNAERIESAVSMLVLDRTTQTLVQNIWWEDFHHIAEFHDIKGDYNRIWDFRNPLSNKVGTTRSRRATL